MMRYIEIEKNGEELRSYNGPDITPTAPNPPQSTTDDEIKSLKARAQAAEDALMFLMENGGM